ncbi:MAG TPA: DNA primase small subunit domain-containing protein, partial [Candidatus Paceibacterota bacterium]|nr:DNA primase small subunit domain-containing protein [Candidatus Paceibacterota bacterium]
LCDDKETLLYMANLGCIEINPWHSRVDSLEHPDYCLIDLDPQVKDFDIVVETAQVVHEILEKAGAKSFIKTTGKRGLHVLVPLGGQYTYEQSRQFAQVVAQLAHEQLPKTTSLERSPAKRRGKVYLDYLQNGKGQTMAAPYCLRPIEGLRVSTPLEWKEVKSGLSPADYTVHNIHKRLEKYGDLLHGLLGKGIDMEKVLSKLEK